MLVRNVQAHGFIVGMVQQNSKTDAVADVLEAATRQAAALGTSPEAVLRAALARAEERPPGGEQQQREVDQRSERQILSAAGFFTTFAVTRAITHLQRATAGPRRFVPIKKLPGGKVHRHHHMVAGILSLIAVGYAWLLQVGTDRHRPSRAVSRLTSVLFGVGSALTLDEFALWLNLEDDYWSSEGRESIDAVALFGLLLLAGGTSGH